MELEAENWRLCSRTLVRRVSGELGDENWRLCSAALARGVSGELEEEYWRLCSTIVVRGVAAELEDENWRLRSKTLDAEDLASRDPHRQGLIHTHHTQRPTRCLNLLGHTHRQRLIRTQT